MKGEKMKFPTVEDFKRIWLNGSFFRGNMEGKQEECHALLDRLAEKIRADEREAQEWRWMLYLDKQGWSHQEITDAMNSVRAIDIKRGKR